MRSNTRRRLLTLSGAALTFAVLGSWMAAAQVLVPRAYVAAPIARADGYLRVIEEGKEIPIATPFGLGREPSDVAVHPLGIEVYVSDLTDNTIAVVDPVKQSVGLVIDPERALSRPKFLAIAPKGVERLYVSNDATRTVSIVSLDPPATVVRTTDPLVTSGAIGALVAMDVPGAGPRVYVAAETAEALLVLDGDGNPLAGVRLPRSPFALGRHPLLPVVYVAFDTPELGILDATTNDLRVIDLRDEFELTNSNFLTEALDVTPDGRRLVIGVRSPDATRVYDLDSGGMLQRCRAAYPAGHDPIAVSVSSDGRLAYTVSRRDRLVSVISPGAANESCAVTNDGELARVPTGIVELLAGGDVQAFGPFTAPGVGPRCGDGSVNQETEQCDDGNTLDGDCCSSTCRLESAGSPCADDGQICTSDVCNGQGVCIHSPGNEGTTCRPAAGACDLPEVCTGGSAACPVDGFRSAATVCRAAAGVCDVAETCPGNAAGCPTDGFAAAATVCRAAAGVCDVAETCPGNAAGCPTDGFAAAATVCRAAAGVCDVAETCPGNAAGCPTDGFASAATVCRAAAGVCDVAETCPGNAAACPANAFAAAATVCRAAAGVCDVAETCPGNAAGCPTDGFAAAATVCRAAAGVCDVAETCPGNAAGCPTDGFASAATVCRAAAGVCDVAETCPGNAAGCPANAFASAATVCRPAAGVCDVAETCPGNAAGCPANAFASAATVCRAAAGVCDVAETCLGNAAGCPTDGFASAATVCRAAAGVCDVAETCPGNAAGCPTDGFAAAATVCRAAAGVCDVAETCPGNAAGCPTDGFASAATVCRAAAGVCDVAETCPGNAAGCPTDGFASAATVCRAAAGVCDVAETCPGNAAACPGDGFAPTTTVCRTGSDACDLAETCSGKSAGCPADEVRSVGEPCPDDGRLCTVDACDGTSKLCRHELLGPECGSCTTDAGCDDGLPCTVDSCVEGSCQNLPGNAGVTCRPAAGTCDVAESCTGESGECPADQFLPAASECRPAAGVCDVGERCTGGGPSCPDDAFAPASTVCRPAAGACDTAETCSGSAATCPPDAFRPSGSVCRAAAGACDVAEVCTGASAACPSDRVQPAGALCRPAGFACDEEELCDGAATACPADLARPDEAVCDDGDPHTGTSACKGQVCLGVAVKVEVPPPPIVPPTLSAKKVKVPVNIEVPAGPGAMSAEVILQGVVNCLDLLDLPALPAECASVASGTPARYGVRLGSVSVPVTPRRRRTLGGVQGRAVNVRLPLNKLGRLLFPKLRPTEIQRQLPMQIDSTIRDRQGGTIAASFQALLERRR